MPREHFLDQFQGQFYRARYVDGFLLVEFADAMDGLFDAIYTITSVQIKIKISQWQSRKNTWEKKWDIKNGGPSPDIRSKLLSQRTWWYKGINGKPAYKPLTLDNHTLSILPAGLSIATDINIPNDQHELDETMKNDRNGSQLTEVPGYSGLNTDPTSSLRNPWPYSWPSKTIGGTEEISSSTTSPIENLPPLTEVHYIPPKQYFGLRCPMTYLQHQSQVTMDWTTPYEGPPYDLSTFPTPDDQSSDSPRSRLI